MMFPFIGFAASAPHSGRFDRVFDPTLDLKKQENFRSSCDSLERSTSLDALRLLEALAQHTVPLFRTRVSAPQDSHARHEATTGSVFLRVGAGWKRLGSVAPATTRSLLASAIVHREFSFRYSQLFMASILMTSTPCLS
jgi:hypothetical protein